jgi:transcription initiation factor TFIID TATA-box-binding protein
MTKWICNECGFRANETVFREQAPFGQLKCPECGNQFMSRSHLDERQLGIIDRMKRVVISNIKINNIVALVSFERHFDLTRIAHDIRGTGYDPEIFPGLNYRIKIKKSRICMIIFESGKVICTGAKSFKDVETAIGKVAKQIEASGIRIKIEPKIEVQNIFASSNLETEINLNSIAISLGRGQVEYKPDQFPGLVYRIDSPKVTFTLFGSGKLVCTGAQKLEDVNTAFDSIKERLAIALSCDPSVGKKKQKIKKNKIKALPSRLKKKR